MMITMNRKLVYVLPVLIAVVALAVAMPHVMADRGMGWGHKGKFHGGFAEIDGFTGTIPITKDTDKSTLKDQIKISLKDAVNKVDADVQGAHIGIVANENGDKFLAWILTSVEKTDSAVTMTIHVVDAGDGHQAVTTKSFDHSFKKHDESSKS